MKLALAWPAFHNSRPGMWRSPCFILMILNFENMSIRLLSNRVMYPMPANFGSIMSFSMLGYFH